MSSRIAALSLASPKPKKRPLIEALNDDCLDLIIQQVSLTSYKTLFSLVTVNCRLYRLAVRWIYRDITINVTKVTHLLLLKRLLQPISKLPSYIRYLEITPADFTPLWFLRDVTNLMKRLTALHTLCWNVFSNVYPRVLRELARIPKARLLVRGTKIAYYPVFPFQKTLPLLTVLLPSRLAFPDGNLTTFTFDAELPSQIYYNFKKDLLRLMVNNPLLTTLSLQPKHFSLETFPKMLEVFRHGKVPSLTHLAVRGWALPIFHQDELELWGKRTGWEALRTLSIDITSFPALVGKTPGLARLELTATTAADLIQLQLQLLEMGYPDECWLPKLAEFYLETPLDRMFVSIAHRPSLVLPVILFGTMPNLLTMDMGSSFTMSIDSVSFVPTILATPEAKDIRKMRDCCPLIQDLCIDVTLDKGWPLDVLDEIAQFQDLQNMTLMLHFVSVNNAKRRMTLPNCEDAFRYITRSRSPPYGKQELREGLAITFILARKSDDRITVRRGFDMPDYVVWTDTAGIHTRTYNYEAPSTLSSTTSRLELMSDLQLRKRAQKASFVWHCTKLFLPIFSKHHRQATLDLKKVWQEGQRRRLEAAGGKLNDQITLFDQWRREWS